MNQRVGYCEEWKQSRHDGDWKDAVAGANELEPEYLNKHSSTIHAGCKWFEIYCLSHSALTMLAESGCAFTLARNRRTWLDYEYAAVPSSSGPMQSKEPSEISQVGTELGTCKSCL